MPKPTTIYETLIDGPANGPSGPAGDGIFVVRFRRKADADAFVASKTCYGRAPTVTPREATREQLRRWGLG